MIVASQIVVYHEKRQIPVLSLQCEEFRGM